jgi:GNAT superfamily N-acetyltransferase
MEYDVYREMYSALAEHFVAAGYFDHMVYLAPSDAAALDAFHSLGFGRALTAAIRGVDPAPASPAARVDLHHAAAEDAEVVHGLNDELMEHHARSPIFWPHMSETDAASREFQSDLLKDPKTNAHVVAYENGRPLGMNSFMAPFWLSPLVAPEKTVYLYQGVVSQGARGGGVGSAILAEGVAWAREQGYEHIGLHFASPNISGARFWQSNGFKPVEHRLVRHIDERIAWAGVH